MSTVGTRLSQALADSGIDQSMLARRVGTTQRRISKIILGKTANSRFGFGSGSNWACPSLG
jgi:plasmid maintenance system antidote protein VapI